MARLNWQKLPLKYDVYDPKGTARDLKFRGVTRAKAAKLLDIDADELIWSIDECERCDFRIEMSLRDIVDQGRKLGIMIYYCVHSIRNV